MVAEPEHAAGTAKGSQLQLQAPPVIRPHLRILSDSSTDWEPCIQMGMPTGAILPCPQSVAAMSEWKLRLLPFLKSL